MILDRNLLSKRNYLTNLIQSRPPCCMNLVILCMRVKIYCTVGPPSRYLPHIVISGVFLVE